MSRNGNPQDPRVSRLSNEDSFFSLAEKRLWNAVLLLAAQDARSAKAALRAETHAWLLTRDFVTVCEWAGHSPDGIRQAIERILKQKSATTGDKTEPFLQGASAEFRMPLARKMGELA